MLHGAEERLTGPDGVHPVEQEPHRCAPSRVGFDSMRTRYRIDTCQKTYFVIDDFEQLFDATRPDFAPIYAELAPLESFPAGSVQPSDRVINRGTGEGWLSGGDV